MGLPSRKKALWSKEDDDRNERWDGEQSGEAVQGRRGQIRSRKYLAQNYRKLTETSDPEIKQEIRDRIKNLERELSDIKLERESRLEALSANRAALRSQINRIRRIFRRILHEDTTLAERICTLFRKQGNTIASILTAAGMAVSTLVLALTGGGGVCTPRHHLPSHPTRAIWRSGWENTPRPLGVPWLIKLARLPQPCLESLALLSLGS